LIAARFSDFNDFYFKFFKKNQNLRWVRFNVGSSSLVVRGVSESHGKSVSFSSEKRSNKLLRKFADGFKIQKRIAPPKVRRRLEQKENISRSGYL